MTATAVHGSRQGVALLVITAATLLVVLDSTIVNVALPSIRTGLGFTTTGLEWVVTAYSVAFGGLLLLGGRLGDLYGRRRMFLVGIALFTAASLLGGLALTQLWLIAARTVQGIGAAIAAPAALSLVATTFPEGEPRNRAMGWYATVAGSAGAIGLVLGGLLTHVGSWRWVFFVAVPIGALVLVAAPRALAEPPRQDAGRLDLAGAITGTAGVALLVYGLIQPSWPVAAAGIVVLLVFLVIESRVSTPLLPLRLFADGRRAAAYAVTLTVGVGLYGVTFFLMLYVQETLAFGAVLAGLAFLPLAAGIGVLAAAMGRLAGRIGTRVGVVGGPLVAAAGAVWLYAGVSAHTGYAGLVGPLVLLGVGLGAAVVPLTLTVLAAVRREDAGIASALVSAGQQLGGAIGLAALGAAGAPAAYLVAAAVLVLAAAIASRNRARP
ncbi:MFS transporter [Fodinicola acaciae]|uniref:MFS transporter n=1 Tax=Fodinicola acaciae TaxID=2681555 RepID=UPI0013D57FB1|nr:MFS transporter [Fodinicola acaciae]